MYINKFSLFRYVSSALNLRSIIFYPDHIFHFSLFLSLHLLHETCLYYNQLLSTVLFLVLNVPTHQKGSEAVFFSLSVVKWDWLSTCHLYNIASTSIDFISDAPYFSFPCFAVLYRPQQHQRFPLQKKKKGSRWSWYDNNN